MKKRWAALFLCLCLMFTLFPVAAYAEEGWTSEVTPPNEETRPEAASANGIAPRIAYDILWIGNTRITDSGYWTTDGNGNLTASDAGNYNIAFDADTNTLTLNNANIAGQYDFTYNNVGAGIWAYSKSGAVSLNIQVTGNNVVSGSYGIYALSNGGFQRCLQRSGGIFAGPRWASSLKIP